VSFRRYKRFPSWRHLLRTFKMKFGATRSGKIWLLFTKRKNTSWKRKNTWLTQLHEEEKHMAPLIQKYRTFELCKCRNREEKGMRAHVLLNCFWMFFNFYIHIFYIKNCFFHCGRSVCILLKKKVPHASDKFSIMVKFY